MVSTTSEIARNIVITVFSVVGSLLLTVLIIFVIIHFFVKGGGVDKLFEWIFTK